jgi:acetylornithine/succinyldiaminopimelate/putrescine aminotransferase
MSSIFPYLEYIKSHTGEAYTRGIRNEYLVPFLERKDLSDAVEDAFNIIKKLPDEDLALLALPEKELLGKLQDGFLNFYNTNSISPYIPLAAKGPWIITAYGSVVYDTGGYGMLGFGHNPSSVNEKIAHSYVMANIMTASLAQPRVISKIKNKIGHTRDGGCPFEKFIFMNSGSESMSVSTRISDLHAGVLITKGGIHAGKIHKICALRGSFHGRTGRPARASSSSFKAYRRLASFKNYTSTLLVEPNNISDLERVFKRTKDKGQYLEFFIMEPVMGEGNPGLAITPEFYKRARELTREHHSLLIVDSIQAGMRTNGVLSIVDYPGFQNLDPPDMETYSKAINGGQFPVSILAISKELSKIYTPGVYGNTMTANPRALEVTSTILDMCDDSVRLNIIEKGREFKERLIKLQSENKKITKVQGTGLLISSELSSELSCFGFGSVEDIMRRNGVNVIHGGKNALRFTPWFNVNTDEIELIIKVLTVALESSLS